MTTSPAPCTRRQWLARSGLGALALGSLGNLLPARSARADTGYRALVCVFLYGGNDGLNTIVPTDDARYTQYSNVRQRLALPRASLSALTGSEYGLHPALAALQTAWRERRLAAPFNVGPLQAPLSKADYLSAKADLQRVPGSLYSHADQQILWETGTCSSLTRTGWGGRAAEQLAAGSPVISVGGNARFGMSSSAGPLVLPDPGANFGAHELADQAWRLQYAPTAARANALRALYAQAQDTELGDVYARMQRDAFEVSARLGPTVQSVPGDANASAGIDAAFAPLISGGRIGSALGRQLYQVAKLIAGRDVVQGQRRIFFAQQGGFDTHASQATNDPTQGTHAGLLRQLGDALAAFDAAMKNLGMGEAVTLFTQSDFGRTFEPNGNNGTDHAWGNHQLVMGGAVKGGTTYGRYPELLLGGQDDVGSADWELQGRWIPGLSVDQYAATLLSWFGAGDAQLDAILPNLPNFATRRLGFV